MGNAAGNPDLGNLGLLSDNDELNNTFKPQNHFIIHFNSVSRIPASQYTSECRPYIRSFIGIPQELESGEFSIEKLSFTVCTPVKADHTDKPAIWQTYRDFYTNPRNDAFLVVEIMNAKYESGDIEILGTAFVPVSDLVDDTMRTYIVTYGPNQTNIRADVPFTVSLRRVFVDKPPPRQKTIFLVRHGESKWNKAQAKGNIGGLLNLDHALTEVGIQQAIDLNERWKARARTVSLLQNVNEDWESYALPAPRVDNSDDFEDDDDEDDDDDDASLARSLNNTTHDLLDFDVDFEERPNLTNNSQLKKTHSSRSSRSGKSPKHSPPKSRSMSPTPLEKSNAKYSNIGELLDMNEMEILAVDTAHPNSTTEAKEALVPLIVTDDQQFLDDYHLKPNQEHSPHHDPSMSVSEVLLLQGRDSNKRGISAARFITSEEAVEARRNEYILKFLNADAVYSSPLTRAIETAFLVMDGHPASERGLTLYSHLREVKKIGGLDSVGMVHGNEIEERVKAELVQVVGRKRCDEIMIESLHYNDCNSPWWTSISSYEKDAEQQDRVREFISFARYSEHNLPVFVGHSLFFRAFYKKRISNILAKNRPELAYNLKKYRLSNATLMAVTLQFVDRPTGCDAIIIDADLIFGGGFHGIKDDDEGDVVGGEKLSGISPSAGSAIMEKFENFRSTAAEKISSLSHHTRDVKSIAKKIIGGFKGDHA